MYVSSEITEYIMSVCFFQQCVPTLHALPGLVFTTAQADGRRNVPPFQWNRPSLGKLLKRLLQLLRGGARRDTAWSLASGWSTGHKDWQRGMGVLGEEKKYGQTDSDRVAAILEHPLCFRA